MTCRFYVSEEMVAREEGYYEGCCSLGSSSIKVECNGGNDETKCGLALSMIAELKRWVEPYRENERY